MEGLEHEAQVLPAQARSAVFIELRKILAAQHHPPFGGMIESGQQRQQRGLARSGRPHQRAGFATFQAQVDMLENLKFPFGTGHSHAEVFSA